MLYNALTILVVTLTIYAQVILRYRINTGVSDEVSKFSFMNLYNLFTDFWIFTALSAFFLSFVCWSYVLSSDLNITKIYPVVYSSTILLVCLANFFIFNDPFKLVNFCGILVVIVGIFLILK
jgi:multidrug transporter EmrE-like cation transporter